MADLFGTSFAQTGFTYDPNLSPNNRSFLLAVLAVTNRAGVGTSTFALSAGTATFAISAGTASSLTTAAFANPSVKVSTTATNGAATTALRSDGAPAIDQAMSPTWTGTHTFNPGTGPSAVFKVNGVTILLANGTAAPSLQGYGPVAAGLVDMTPDSAIFTCTIQGVTPAVTTVCTARRSGNIVTLSIGGVQGTSNTNALSIAPLPAAWQSPINVIQPCIVVDQGVSRLGFIQIQPSNGTIIFAIGGVSGTLLNYNQNGFAGTGQKGPNLTVTTYQLA